MIKTKKPDTLNIDWEEVGELTSMYQATLPDNAITADKLMEQFGVKRTTAYERLNKLIASDLYEEMWMLIGRNKVKYAVRKAL